MLTAIVTGSTVQIAPTVQSYRLRTDGFNAATLTFTFDGATVWGDACVGANLAQSYDGPPIPMGSPAGGGLPDPAKSLTVTVAGVGAVAYVYST